jgi:hypothetical protein
MSDEPSQSLTDYELGRLHAVQSVRADVRRWAIRYLSLGATVLSLLAALGVYAYFNDVLQTRVDAAIDREIATRARAVEDRMVAVSAAIRDDHHDMLDRIVEAESDLETRIAAIDRRSEGIAESLDSAVRRADELDAATGELQATYASLEQLMSSGRLEYVLLLMADNFYRIDTLELGLELVFHETTKPEDLDRFRGFFRPSIELARLDGGAAPRWRFVMDGPPILKTGDRAEPTGSQAPQPARLIADFTLHRDSAGEAINRPIDALSGFSHYRIGFARPDGADRAEFARFLSEDLRRFVAAVADSRLVVRVNNVIPWTVEQAVRPEHLQPPADGSATLQNAFGGLFASPRTDYERARLFGGGDGQVQAAGSRSTIGATPVRTGSTQGRP